ncbi:hypothetical protein ACO22_04330 [Paracoccidioides brasiliensis]|uniref:Uncharacterized protein n=1 Tax=Paracoccidioides brasiliensis TaxID=121759 RepID=A0A1D2JDN1_PARBR|nr:hypothetical protein ACO22_04330 [Paracoccidioides brasiliensis]ODH50452.1 hypothetical protein GX48_03413 [Paracoccidioides brasiliensis]
MLANWWTRISSEANDRVKRALLLDAPPGNKVVLFDSLLRPYGDKILSPLLELPFCRPSLVTSYGNGCLDYLKALNVGLPIPPATVLTRELLDVTVSSGVS